MRICCQPPARLAQRHRLADQPGARAAAFGIAPMFWLGDRLAIDLEEQIGMAGGGDIRIEILMTGDTGIGADVKAL